MSDLDPKLLEPKWLRSGHMVSDGREAIEQSGYNTGVKSRGYKTAVWIHRGCKYGNPSHWPIAVRDLII